MEGSVELIEYPCEGYDFCDDQPDWRGMASLIYPVSDLGSTL
jgi:hypothetical protein